MSIPLTASTETFTPKCMAEFEDAPAFTFRHATVLDKTQFAYALTDENITFNTDEAIRKRIVSELRTVFTSEGMEQNITRLDAYWQAADEFKSAMSQYRDQVLEILRDAEESEEPELPPAPVFEFDEREARDLELLIAQVNEESDFLRLMRKQNLRYQIEHPKLLLRMYLASTTLPVELKRKDKLITRECCEQLYDALRTKAKRLSVDPDEAISELQTKAMMQFLLTEDEEKNSSSPRSVATGPAQSEKKASPSRSTSEPTTSTGPANAEPDSGLNSPE